MKVGDKILMMRNCHEGERACMGVYEISRINGNYAYLKNYDHELIIDSNRLFCNYRVDEGFVGFMHYVGPIDYWSICFEKEEANQILDKLLLMKNKYYMHNNHNYRIAVYNMYTTEGKKLKNYNEYIEYLKTLL